MIWLSLFEGIFMKTTKGCCGLPTKCAFTTHDGRCKAREEFEQRATDERVRARKLARIERKQMERQRNRGRGVGREMGY